MDNTLLPAPRRSDRRPTSPARPGSAAGAKLPGIAMSASSPELHRPGTAGATEATVERRSRVKLSELGQQQLFALARSMGASNYDLVKASVASDNRVLIDHIRKLQKVEKQRYLVHGGTRAPYTYQEFLEFFGGEAPRRWDQAAIRKTPKAKGACNARMDAALRLTELPWHLCGSENRLRKALGDGIIANIESISHWSEDRSSCAVRYADRRQAELVLKARATGGDARSSFHVAWWQEEDALPPPVGWECRPPPAVSPKQSGCLARGRQNKAWVARAKIQDDPTDVRYTG